MICTSNPIGENKEKYEESIILFDLITIPQDFIV